MAGINEFKQSPYCALTSSSENQNVGKRANRDAIMIGQTCLSPTKPNRHSTSPCMIGFAAHG